jgi:hypothetical protein
MNLKAALEAESIPWAVYCVRRQEQIEAGRDEGSAPDFDEPQAA